MRSIYFLLLAAVIGTELTLGILVAPVIFFPQSITYKKDVGFIMFFVGSLVGVTSHTTPLPTGEGPGEGPPPHGLETVRLKPP